MPHKYVSPIVVIPCVYLHAYHYDQLTLFLIASVCMRLSNMVVAFKSITKNHLPPPSLPRQVAGYVQDTTR